MHEKTGRMRGLAAGAMGVMLAGGMALGAPAGAADPHQDLWEQLDIIPMPKEITLTGRTIPLDDPSRAVLVLGAAPTRQSVIGAEWINARLVEHGGQPLPVVAPANVPAGALQIVIGTPADNPLLAQAVADREINVGANNPGVRGYVIQPASDGAVIHLAGADDIGALYACVTFGELLRRDAERVVWRAAAVRDWPDCVHILSGYSVLTTDDPERKEDYKAFFDRLLRWKITGVSHRQSALNGRSFEHTPAIDALREVIQYGKERGIGSMIYAEKPYVGLAANHPDAAADKDRVLEAAVTAQHEKWIRGWEFDDIRRATARNLAEYIRATGFTDVAFHDTDTGGWDNPAQWNFRPPASKERWGDDYAAATAHIHKIYYEEIKRLNPDVRVHFIFYPYTIWIFDDAAGLKALDKTIGGQATASVLRQYQERYTAFWKTLHAAFPVDDVTFGIREATPTAVRNWRKLVPGRGALVWQALMSKWWTPLFSETAAWTPTFCDNLNDYLYVTYAGDILPLQVLAVREYSWNRNTPGAASWALLDSAEHWRHAEPRGEIYSMVLPKLARNVFGHQAAPYIVRALTCNVEPDQLLGQVRSSGFNLLQSPERMEWAAGQAARAADALDELWAQCLATGTPMGMDDYAYRRFVILRECLAGCRWMGAIRARLLQAETLAGAGRLDDAQAAIAAGLADVERGQAAMRQLLAERPASAKIHPRTRRAMAHTLDFKGIAAELNGMLPTLDKYAANAQIFNAIFDQLEQGRMLKMLQIPAASAPVLDGTFDDPAWRAAWPIECFTVIGHGRKMAQAFTRAQLVCDGENIHAAVECRVPAGLTVQDKDTVDVFLANRAGMGSDYAQLSLSADRTFILNYHQKTPMVAGWNTPHLEDGSWPIEFAVNRETNVWRAEIKIPMRPMLHPGKAFGPWSLNLSRNCYFENAATEISGILPLDAANKHDVPRYPTLQTTTNPAPPPDVTINAANLKIETVTLPDRIATVASFNVVIDANLVLNDVVLTAETYGPDGRRQRVATLATFDSIHYQALPAKTFEAEFSEVVPQGGILLKIKSAESQSQHWLRFGGWEGTDGVGAIFAPGPAGRPALHGACFFPSMAGMDDEQHSLFAPDAGTVEMLISPTREQWRVPGRKWSVAGEALFCFGPYKRSQNPIVVRGLPLGIVLYRREILTFVTTKQGLAGGMLTVRLPEKLLPDQWHHLACVWDAAAPAADRMRVYFDGRRVAAGAADDAAAPADAKPVGVDADLIRSIQIGALKSGYFASDLRLASLRISRTARYAGDFDAAPRLALDRDTTAFFEFDGSLAGAGMTPAGRQYAVQAVAGIDY